ncbi:MAG: putative bifunctional diguanylate cyclase/phosphodiesterase [Acidimicrobiia bacterium]
MRQRLWMTAAALAAPTISLLVGLAVTFGTVRLANTIVGDRREDALAARLTAAAAVVDDRLGAVDAADPADPALADPALLDGLDVGPDTGLGVQRDRLLVAHNVGQARLTALDRVPLPGHPELSLVALGPSSYFADATPAVLAGVGLSATVLLSVGIGVWSLQGRRRREVEHDLARTHHDSRHDALTGLANRPHLMEWLEARLADCALNDRSLGLIFIDVDRFKTINDTMGHAAGDELLKEVARRLSGSVRGGDLVARLAGDEFVVAFPGVADAEKLVELAERCQRAFDEPVELGPGPLYASLSMGLAIGDRNTPSIATLLEQADAAMYVAKSTPGTQHAFFDERLRAEADSRQVLGDALRAGLEAGELALHYQPVVAVGSGTTTGVEAFVRWHRPGHGVLTPGAFLSVAEETGLIGAIGRMVVGEACRQAALWNPADAEVDPLPVAINVSERQLLAPDFVDVVRRAIDDSGVRPQLLQIELHETMAADKRVRSAGVLDELAALGVSLVIDDFGFRHGSLGILKDLPLAAVKIHGSAITDVADDESDQAMIEAVVNLTNVLGTMVVAENVETPAQLAMLRRLGVRFVQGHLFLPPVPAEELSALTWTRQLELRHGTGIVLTAGTARTEAV